MRKAIVMLIAAVVIGSPIIGFADEVEKAERERQRVEHEAAMGRASEKQLREARENVERAYGDRERAQRETRERAEKAEKAQKEAKERPQKDAKEKPQKEANEKPQKEPKERPGKDK